MEEKKKELLRILQSNVKGYVNVEDTTVFGGWIVTILYRDVRFGVIIFEENAQSHTEFELARYVLEKYKEEIHNYYFK